MGVFAFLLEHPSGGPALSAFWGSRSGRGWLGCAACPPAPAIQVWSITYHSWLTFVLLLWACLIWTVRSRHQLAMLCSPFILLYGLALCGLRYVWAMDLHSELPTTLGPVSLRQLGLEHTRYPCLDLGAMLLYTLTFWLLLRQFVKEKLLRKKKVPSALMEVTVADTGERTGPLGQSPPAWS